MPAKNRLGQGSRGSELEVGRRRPATQAQAGDRFPPDQQTTLWHCAQEGGSRNTAQSLNDERYFNPLAGPCFAKPAYQDRVLDDWV